MSDQPTKKQIENVRWLYKHFGTDEFISSAFLSRYEDEWVAKHGGRQLHIGTNRRHGFRRASGTSCMRLEDAGLIKRKWTGDRYGMYYVLTERGLELARAGT